MNSAAAKLLAAVTALFCLPIILTSGIVANAGDIFQYAAPFRHFAAASLQAGNLPLWNPYIFCGAPFLASPQSSLFYPASGLFWSLPLKNAFNLFSVLHLFLNALGMFLLLRTVGKSRSGSFFGSIAWAFSFFFLARLSAGHVIHLSGYCWAPYVWLFTVRLIRSESKLSILLLLAASLLQFFSGHIQVWIHTSIFAGFLWLWALAGSSSDGKRRLLKDFCVLSVALAALSLVQSLPTLHYLLLSSRQGTDPQSAYLFATSYSMEWKSLIGLILPDFFGNPLNGTFIDPEHPSVFFETYAVYFGILPALFAVGGLLFLSFKKRFLLPAAALLFLFLAAGKNSAVYNAVWQSLSFIRVPARFFFLSFAAMILAAVFFWDRFLRNGSPALKAVLVSAVFLDLFLNGHAFIRMEDPAPKLGKTETAAWIEKNNNSLHSASQTLWRMMTGAEVPNPNKCMMLRLENANGYEAIWQKSTLDFFLNTQGPASVTTTGIDAGSPDSNAFKLLSVRYLLRFSGDAPGPEWELKGERPPLKLYENASVLPSARAVFSLKTFQDETSLYSYLNSDSFRPAEEILKIEKDTGEERLPAKDLALKWIERTGPNKIKTVWLSTGTAACWLFLSESYYPGWKAWNGSGERLELFPACGTFQGLRLERTTPPTERVYWLFEPDDFKIGACVSVAALILFAALIFRRFAFSGLFL